LKASAKDSANFHFQIIHFIRCFGCSDTGPLRSSRGPLQTNLPLFSRRWSFPLHRIISIGAPSPANAASEWRPSLPARIDSVSSSCVLSISLVGERLLHFQLNRNTEYGRAITSARLARKVGRFVRAA